MSHSLPDSLCSELTVRPSTRELIQRGIEPEPAQEDLWSADRARPPTFRTPVRPQVHLLEAQPAHFECRLVPINDPDMQVRTNGNWTKQISKNGNSVCQSLPTRLGHSAGNCKNVKTLVHVFDEINLNFHS